MTTATQEFEIRDALRRIGICEEDIAIIARHYERIEKFFVYEQDTRIEDLEQRIKELQEEVRKLSWDNDELRAQIVSD